MLSILRQPYPFFEKSFGRALLSCFGEGAFIALFLIIFEPFGLANWHDPNKYIYLSGYGVVTALGGIILRFGIFKTFPKYHSEATWNVGKEIISIMLIMILITIGNFIYTALLFKSRFGWSNLWWMFMAVLILGIFPTTFGVMVNYIYQLKKYNKTIVVQHSQFSPSPISNKNEALTLIAENEKDSLELLQSNLLYIESSDNYSTVFSIKQNKIHKDLLRSSLTRLQSQINSNTIVRCHRSYIVNLDKVEKVTGNAQGYKLHLDTLEIVVPVARKYSDIVDRLK